MKTSIIFSIYLVFVMSIEFETELKVKYYEKLIKEAIRKANNYKLPTDNSAYFKNASLDIKDFGKYDFIIVGAGSSGSVVASRLSEFERFEILLLEAGGWDNDLSDIPQLAPVLQLSERNWGYYTTPQKNGCYGSKGRKCPYPRGKVIGGTGSINNLAYARGNQADYDTWSRMGNQGWSFKDVLPYFKKLENYKSDDIDLRYRGFAGPVNTVFGNLKGPFDILSEPLKEICSEIIADYNGAQQIGTSRNQKNTENARRVSGGTAYVRPSMSRHNFNVTVRAFVTKLLINPITKTVYGVEFIKNGQRYKATAKREIILSAGAINSPQLLMLSGIGPRDELLKHAIPIISDLPVGKQLKEHYKFSVSYKFNNTQTFTTYRQAILEYLNGTGILGRAGNRLAIAYINTKNASSSVPTLEIGYYLPSTLNENFPSQSNNIDEMLKYNKKLRNTFEIAMFLLHPKSSGTLKLKSNSIIHYPLIDIAIFRNAEDMESIYEGIQYITQLEETELAKKYNAKQVKFQLCDQKSNSSEEYWLCALQYLATPGLHISTTAKMGPKSDPYAVVDYKLRVYGVKGLRVADCSVMPTPISGHNNGPAFMIGEKAADMIKRDNAV